MRRLASTRSKVLHQPFHEVAAHPTVQEAGRPSRNGTGNGTVSPKGKFFIEKQATKHGVGGDGGIRTLGTLIEYGSLAGNWFQPLTHVSGPQHRCERAPIVGLLHTGKVAFAKKVFRMAKEPFGRAKIPVRDAFRLSHVARHGSSRFRFAPATSGCARVRKRFSCLRKNPGLTRRCERLQDAQDERPFSHSGSPYCRVGDGRAGCGCADRPGNCAGS